MDDEPRRNLMESGIVLVRDAPSTPTPLTLTRSQRRRQQRDHQRAEKRARKLEVPAPVASGRELLDTAKYLMCLEQGQFQALILAVFSARFGVAGRAKVARVMGCEAEEAVVLPPESTLWTPGSPAPTPTPNVRRAKR